MEKTMLFQRAYIRATADKFNILGIDSFFEDDIRAHELDDTVVGKEAHEFELRESFSNSCVIDDPAVYFWARVSYGVYRHFKHYDDECFAYVEPARLSDPKSGFFIHEGVVYLSTESEALAARIAADEQRELSALLGEVGSKSKGGRL